MKADEKEKKQSVDGIKGQKAVKAEPAKEVKTSKPSSSLTLKVTDYRVPSRGIIWHIAFFLIFIVSAGASIYFFDWALLFFIVIFAGYTLFRGLKGNTFELEIAEKGIRVNQKIFLFEQIESYHFTYDGENATVTFAMMKKLYPKLTFMLSEEKDVEKIRQKLGAKVPETEPRDESWSDFIIRELKL